MKPLVVSCPCTQSVTHSPAGTPGFRDGVYEPYYFNQYTGEDLGPGRPWPIKAVEGLANVQTFAGLKPESARQYNVLLYIVDSLRADHLPLYGYAKNTSPALTRLAKEVRLSPRASASLVVMIPPLARACSITRRVLSPIPCAKVP